MSQKITINLPDPLYHKLTQAADLAQQPLDIIIAQSLDHTLSPLLEEIPPPYQADVYPLLEMDAGGLQQEVQRVFPLAEWTEYETLLAEKKIRPLDQIEQTRLDDLRYRADLLTLRKGYAALLLKRQGYTVPALGT